MNSEQLREYILDIPNSIQRVEDNTYEKLEEKRKERRQREIMEARLLSIPARYADATFDNFITDKKGLVEYMKSGKSAIFYGKNGTGKTYLAFASIHYQIEHHVDARYILAADFFAMIKNSYSTGNEAYKKYYTVPYLVVDEIDKRFGTQVEFIGLYQLINERYNHVLPTVLITNGSKDELIDIIGASSFDRIIEDGKLIYFDGKNYRRK
jgi:DNA replication protein DnaC